MKRLTQQPSTHVEAHMHAFAERCRDIVRGAHPAYWLALLATITLSGTVAMAVQGGAL